MSSEIKKRLLLSKWHIATRSRERFAVVLLIRMRLDLETLREKQDDHEEALTERDDYADQLEAALERVKYWLLSGLVHGQLVSNPRDILRHVEDALS